MNKQQFIDQTPPDSEFNFGSNCHGHHNDDGSVYYNSHYLEQWFFDSIEDFAKWYFDDDETVPFSYQYHIGRRNDEDGTITFEEGYSEEQDGIDESEDGSDVWSKLQQKNKD